MICHLQNVVISKKLESQQYVWLQIYDLSKQISKPLWFSCYANANHVNQEAEDKEVVLGSKMREMTRDVCHSI